MTTPTGPFGETDIDRDNWIAVFYVDISLEMSLPCRIASTSCTHQKTSTPKSSVPAIFGATSSFTEAVRYGDERKAPPQRQDRRNTRPIEFDAPEDPRPV